MPESSPLAPKPKPAAPAPHPRPPAPKPKPSPVAGKQGDPVTTSVAAEELARAPNISGIEIPGATSSNQAGGFEVGHPWVDRGEVCAGKVSSECFLDEAQRGRLVAHFSQLITRALVNYKLALVALQVEELLKKDEDLPWVVALVLDLAGAHFVKVAAKAVLALKAGGVAELGRAIDDRYLNDLSWQSRAESFLGSLDDKAIEGSVKTILDPAKKAALAEAKGAANDRKATEKDRKLSFVEELGVRCDLGFYGFEAAALSSAPDATLVALYRGMHPEFHTVPAYKEALADKLKRFRRAGVEGIGRRTRLIGPHNESGIPALTAAVAKRAEDVRVVWVLHDNGTKTLCFQQQLGFMEVPGHGPPLERHYGGQPVPMRFGDLAPPRILEMSNLPLPRMLGTVPEEFWDTAIARSEQYWGETPTVADPFTAHLPKNARSAVPVNGTTARGADATSATPSEPDRAPRRVDDGVPDALRPDLPPPDSDETGKGLVGFPAR